MSKSLVYAANSSTQNVQIGGVVNFGSVVRRYGCNCSLSGGNAVVSGCGYYTVDAAVVLEGTGAGNVTLTLYNDGVAIPGAHTTITVADSTTYNVTIPSAVIRETCACDKTITCVLTGMAADVLNAAVRVIKE